jgi:hypothetical protein
MIGRGTRAALALVMTLAAALGVPACGSDGVGGIDTTGQSLVVITVNIMPGVPDLHQIRVHAHLANPAMDTTPVFPPSPTPGPIPSGATLALLLPTTFKGLLDLTLDGLDNAGQTIANGKGQAMIVVGGRTDVPVMMCPAPGCQ